MTTHYTAPGSELPTDMEAAWAEHIFEAQSLTGAVLPAPAAPAPAPAPAHTPAPAQHHYLPAVHAQQQVVPYQPAPPQQQVAPPAQHMLPAPYMHHAPMIAPPHLRPSQGQYVRSMHHAPQPARRNGVFALALCMFALAFGLSAAVALEAGTPPKKPATPAQQPAQAQTTVQPQAQSQAQPQSPTATQPQTTSPTAAATGAPTGGTSPTPDAAATPPSPVSSQPVA